MYKNKEHKILTPDINVSLSNQDRKKIVIALAAFSSRPKLQKAFFKLIEKAIAGDQGSSNIVLTFADALYTFIKFAEEDRFSFPPLEKSISPTDADFFKIGVILTTLSLRQDILTYYKTLMRYATSGNLRAFAIIQPLAEALSVVIEETGTPISDIIRPDKT